MPYNRHRSKARTATRRARAAKRSGNRYKANRYKRQARTQQRKARQFDSRSRASKRAKANNTRHNYSSSSRNNNFSSSLFRSNNTLFGNSNNNYSSNYRSNNHITYGNGRRFKQFGNTRSAPQRIYHPTKTFEYIVNVEFLPEPTILSMMDTTGDGIADSAAIDTTGDGDLRIVPAVVFVEKFINVILSDKHCRSSTSISSMWIYMTVEHVLCNFLAKFSSEKKISVLLNFMRRPFFFYKIADFN